MMHANSLLAKKGTRIIVVMPATFVEGDLYSNYRKQMAKEYVIQSLIKLPGDVFSKGKISSYAIMLFKSDEEKHASTLIGNAFFENERWQVSFYSETCIESILDGKWIEHKKTVSLTGRIGVEDIFRGNISSAFFTKRGQKILHCSSSFENGVWKPSQCFCKKIPESNCKYVREGDIIINRIGKKAGFWTKYQGEKQLVSDCLIVVRGGSELESYLIQNSIDGRLVVPIKGVATQYISIKDITDIYFIIQKKNYSTTEKEKKQRL